jgi:hypothetical protein
VGQENTGVMVISHSVIREALFEEIRFEKRPEKSEKNILGREQQVGSL